MSKTPLTESELENCCDSYARDRFLMAESRAAVAEKKYGDSVIDREVLLRERNAARLENKELVEALSATVSDLEDWKSECGSPGSPGNEKTARVIYAARALLARLEADK